MFGLFGKKKKETPPREETPEKENGTESEEFRDFAEDFDPEVLDLMVLTGPNGFWGEKKEGEELYSLGVDLTAWLEEDVPGVHEGDFQLVTKGDGMLKEYLQSHVPGDFVLKVKARLEKEGGSRLLMVNLPEPGFDAELKALRDEQRREVTFWMDGLGTFTLVRSVGWFACEVEWLGETVQLTIDQEEDRDGSVETARALMADQEKWDREVRSCALSQIPHSTGEEAPEEGSFLEGMMLESIQVKADGGFAFWFTDGDLSEQHSLRVTGTLSEGPESAVLED